MRIGTLTAAIVYALLLGAGIYLYLSYPLEELVRHEHALRAWIAAQPWTAFGLGLAVYVAASLVPGTAGKSIVAGWLFGFGAGVAMIMSGLTVAAIASFLMSRWLFRRAVEARFGMLVGAFNRAMDTDGAFYLLTVQLTSFPYWIINWVCGASRVSLWTFAWTGFAGVLPGTLIMAFIGARLPTLEALVGRSTWDLLDPVLIGLFVAMPFVPFGVRYAVGVAERRRSAARAVQRC